MPRAKHVSASAKVCTTLICAEPCGSSAQAARRAMAAQRHAARVPGGGAQSSRGAARSRNGRSGATRSRRRVVAATLTPCAFIARQAAAPISESPPTMRNIHQLFVWPRVAPLRPRGTASGHFILYFQRFGHPRRDLGGRQSVDLEQLFLQAVFVREGIRQANADERRQAR